MRAASSARSRPRRQGGKVRMTAGAKETTTRLLSLRTSGDGPSGAGCNVARSLPPTVHHDGARCRRARCTRYPHVPEIAETELGSRSRLLAGPPRCRVRPAGGTGPMVHRAHHAPVRPDSAPRPDVALHHRRRHARSRPRARTAARDAKARTLDFSSKQRRRRRCTVDWGQPPLASSGQCNVYWGQPPRRGDRPPSETVQRDTIAHPSGGRPRRRVSDPGSGVAHPVCFPAIWTPPCVSTSPSRTGKCFSAPAVVSRRSVPRPEACFRP